MITDMIPGHVADWIQRKHAREARRASSPGAAGLPARRESSGHLSPSSVIATAASDCVVIGTTTSNDGDSFEDSLEDDRNNNPASGSAAHPLVYQQWHPAVSILFADIVGFTTLSKEVEPEQVMLMLHGERNE